MTQSTVWQFARRPRWIGALVLALVIAGLFAALGQWQVGRAIDAAEPDGGASETIVPLDAAAAPSAPVTATADGQRVEAASALVPGGAEVIGGRLNAGEPGWWVFARTRTSTADLVVAYGWTADEGEARAVAERLNSGEDVPPASYTGRLVANEAAEAPEEDVDPQTLTALSIPALINRWPDPPADVYQGYIVVDEPLEGLEAIDSPARQQDLSLNWLNVFYAIEWVVFAGFALYLWYRLVRDAWEREVEEALDAEQSARAPAPSAAP
ncbi:hypothetical protein C1I63_09720 [Rathayibacter caricis DSM 15933]|uniref:SURF1-like protein n=1 Tax=Rathayibacter caricis DSM 15933 TaxID=1328867 RepID=A0A2T4UU95_9MICO|nr:SURF1 family cytochrome oxidase biogenesis protein [Rathayibacter caricis]PTL73099.1 hypothetical protein C1I63_09720 [Rathayibacter caricis DSM 15933]